MIKQIKNKLGSLKGIDALEKIKSAFGSNNSEESFSDQDKINLDELEIKEQNDIKKEDNPDVDTEVNSKKLSGMIKQIKNKLGSLKGIDVLEKIKSAFDSNNSENYFNNQEEKNLDGIEKEKQNTIQKKNALDAVIEENFKNYKHSINKLMSKFDNIFSSKDKKISSEGIENKSIIQKVDLIENNLKQLEINSYVKNVIDTMNEKYGTGAGIVNLEKYLMTGNELLITKDNNCRSYIKSLTHDQLSKALNVFSSEKNLHPLFEIKNDLTPKKAIDNYNNIIDYMNKGNGAYNYYEYIKYVDYCKKNNLEYFRNENLLSIPLTLKQLKNQFTFENNVISLKTKDDIFNYFGTMNSIMYDNFINPVKKLSIQESPLVIDFNNFNKIKDLNYVDYLFYKSKFSDSEKATLKDYFDNSVQGKFIKKLTVKEVFGIYQYTCGSGSILSYITGKVEKGGEIEKHGPRIKDKKILKEIVTGIDSAMYKYGKLNKNMILYRGDKFNYLALWKDMPVKNFDDLCKYVGKTVKCETYLSTGVTKDGSFGGEVKWEIYAPVGTKGMYINDLSEYFKEDIEYEYLLDRNTKYRIDKVYQEKEGNKIITKIKATVVM